MCSLVFAKIQKVDLVLLVTKFLVDEESRAQTQDMHQCHPNHVRVPPLQAPMHQIEHRHSSSDVHRRYRDSTNVRYSSDRLRLP